MNTQIKPQRPPGREEYFKKLYPHFLETDLEKIGAAYEFSKAGHEKQMRADGSRYFDHPKRASLMAMKLGIFDLKLIIDLLLHDIREDSHLLTECRMQINFGKDVALDVKLMSKDERVKAIFFQRLKNCGRWRPILGKLLDRNDNMETLNALPREKQIEQVAETRKYFFELCDIATKITPKKWRHVIPVIRSNLEELCKKYE